MKSFFLSAAIIGHALGAAVPAHAPLKRSFSLDVKPQNQGRRDFASDWALAHSRWGNKAAKATLGIATLGEGEGSVAAKPIVHDQAYVTEVEFGTPPQKLRLILDTGSSDVWVQSSDTIYRVNDQGPWAPRYKPGTSSTAERIEKAVWSVEYLDGTTATGIVYRDTLHLGGFRIPNATIESAQIMAPRFETDLTVSGIMGLAKRLPNNISPPSPSFLSILRPHLHRPLFTVDLRRHGPSRFDFGFIDDAIPSDNITWLASRPESPHWDIELDLTAWKDDHPMWMYHRFQATIDTGTSLMFLPDPLASRYWLSIPGVRSSADPVSKAYMFPCSQAESLPDLLFKLPGTEHVLRIPGPYLNYGPLEPDPFFCWGGMQSAQDMDVTVLGDVMLRAVFVAFDVDKNRIGLANKKLRGV